MKLKLKFVFQKDFLAEIVQIVFIGKNIIELQMVGHIAVITIIGTIHQKDEAALLMKETGNKIASLINFI